MKSVILGSRKVSAARFALLAAGAIALAGCETDGASSAAADAPRAAVASNRPDAGAPRTQAAGPVEPAAPAEPMTRSRAARECWMRTEKASAHENLDKRADVVNKCIDEKMKAAGGAAPRT